MYTLFKYLGSFLFILLLSACATPYVAPTTGETATLIITSTVQHQTINFGISDHKDIVKRKSLGHIFYADDYSDFHKSFNAVIGLKIIDKIEVKIPAGDDFYISGQYETKTYQYNGPYMTTYTQYPTAGKWVNNIKSGAVYHLIFTRPDPDEEPKFILNQSVD